jgi:GWxTD domain-containing protein
MKKMSIVVLSVILAAASLPALAMIPEAQQWAEGPVRYLLSSQEKEQLGRVSSKADFDRFVKLFWAKRDPNLETRVNEFKADFDARVAAADKQFAEEGVRGSLTDRGRVLILLGAPAKRWKQSIQAFLQQLSGETAGSIPASSRAAQQIMHGASYDPYKGMADVWVYHRDQIPASVKVPKRVDSVMFVFFDYEGKDHYVLERRFQPSRWAIKALEAAPAALVAHPELVELPTYPLLPGTQAATAEQLAWLGVRSAPWPEGALLAAYPGVMTENIFPTWVFLRLPKGTQSDLAVGRLTSASGEVLGTFQQQIQLLDTKLGAVYELMLPPVEEPATLELALASAGTPVAVHSLAVEPVQAPAEGPFFTPMFAGAEIFQLQDFEAGTPFVFGGYHLVLRPQGHYTRDENLDYFCLVAHPAVGEDGKPKAKMRLGIYQGGTRLKGTPYRDVELSPVEPNVYMFGSQLPLGIFQKGGEFTLKVWLKDAISGQELASELPIVLPAE